MLACPSPGSTRSPVAASSLPVSEWRVLERDQRFELCVSSLESSAAPTRPAWIGAGCRNRTRDLSLTKGLLYLAELTRPETTKPRLSARASGTILEDGEKSSPRWGKCQAARASNSNSAPCRKTRPNVSSSRKRFTSMPSKCLFTRRMCSLTRGNLSRCWASKSA
jgi:hypothetical protein